MSQEDMRDFGMQFVMQHQNLSHVPSRKERALRGRNQRGRMITVRDLYWTARIYSTDRVNFAPFDPQATATRWLILS